MEKVEDEGGLKRWMMLGNLTIDARDLFILTLPFIWAYLNSYALNGSVDAGHWTLDSGPCMLDSGHWRLYFLILFD